MSETKHTPTPGPWAIRRGNSVVEIRTTAGLKIAATEGEYWKNFSDEALANARLMAAAPDLLAAHEQCLTAGNSIANVCIELIGPDFSDRFPPDADTWEVAEAIGPGARFEAWCAWKTIMNTYGAYAKATGEGDQP